jgi:hypothetical protein
MACPEDVAAVVAVLEAAGTRVRYSAITVMNLGILLGNVLKRRRKRKPCWLKATPMMNQRCFEEKSRKDIKIRGLIVGSNLDICICIFIL